MKLLFALLLTSTAAMTAQEPRTIAEAALAAWNDADATQLNAVAHPEFRARCRDARIIHAYVENSPEKKKSLSARQTSRSSHCCAKPSDQSFLGAIPALSTTMFT